MLDCVQQCPVVFLEVPKLLYSLCVCAHAEGLGKDLLSQCINKLHFSVKERKEAGVRGNLSKKYLEMGHSSTVEKIRALEISADYLIQTTPRGRGRNEEVSLWLPASLAVISST